MPATPYHDLFITASSADAFVRARALLWGINATILKSLALTEARAEELMRHLPTPPARPWLLAHRYSAQAWAQGAEALDRQLLGVGTASGWSAQVARHEGTWTGPCVLLP